MYRCSITTKKGVISTGIKMKINNYHVTRVKEFRDSVVLPAPRVEYPSILIFYTGH